MLCKYPLNSVLHITNIVITLHGGIIFPNIETKI